jgi:hypothetical protein
MILQGAQAMRKIFAAIIVLSASTTVVDTAQAEKHGYAQALIGHGQPLAVSGDKIGVEPVHPDEDALTRRIEQDKTRLDRLIEICPSC